jgi:hypothetical protein
VLGLKKKRKKKRSVTHNLLLVSGVPVSFLTLRGSKTGAFNARGETFLLKAARPQYLGVKVKVTVYIKQVIAGNQG